MRSDSVAPSLGILSLWWDVVFARALMWVANPLGDRVFQPHVHLYLADRYGLLSLAYRRQGHDREAGRLEDLAAHHFHLGGGDEPPPAAAMALGAPATPVADDEIRVSPLRFPPRDEIDHDELRAAQEP